jgi:hypothetical protein
MHERYVAHNQTLIDGILRNPGETDLTLRSAIEAQAAQLSGRSSLSQPENPLPTELQRYIRKVALHAYKITDQDVEALKDAGYSEDAIFELTLSAALGAGMARLEIGLHALKGEENASQDH